MQYTEQQLKNLLSQLPADLQQAITSIETSQKIQEVGERHNLLLDKVQILVEETGLVMFGIKKGVDFVRNLKIALGVDENTAGQIAQEINQEVLLKIRESLRKIQEGKESTEIATEETGLNRDEVLRGIEEPHTIKEGMAKANAPIETITRKEALPPVNLPTGTPEVKFLENHPEEESDKPLVEGIGVNLLADKLSKIVRLPAQVKEINLVTEPPKQEPKAYKVDPYREAAL